MATQRSEHRHIIEINGDVQVVGTSLRQQGRNCGKSICEFSDAKTTIKDAKERSAAMRKLVISIVLCIIFMSVEVVGGIKSNSLAILTDAAHLLSDIAAFAISLFSLWATGWKANRQHSYGFFRMEILGALVSVQMIWILTGILIYQAIYRLINDTGEVDGFLMFLVSAFGLVVNTVMALLLGHDHGHGGHDEGHGHGRHDHGHGHEDHKTTRSQGMTIGTHHHQHHGGEHCEHDDEHHHDLAEPLLNTAYEVKPKRKQRNINIQGAYLHVLGDIIQGIGVTISGLVIWYKPEWKVIDLMCTLLFSVIALATTIKLLRNILAILMETTPREVDVTTLERGLLDMEQVAAIHELHVWAITTGKVLLACHVIIKPNVDSAVMLDKIVDYIRSEYNISHVTIQIEKSVD